MNADIYTLALHLSKMLDELGVWGTFIDGEAVTCRQLYTQCEKELKSYKTAKATSAGDACRWTGVDPMYEAYREGVREGQLRANVLQELFEEQTIGSIEIRTNNSLVETHPTKYYVQSRNPRDLLVHDTDLYLNIDDALAGLVDLYEDHD